ncbi:MAG: 3-hydroxyacyl-CoA dehydrogenase family protein [Eubacterium ramulus]
MRKVPIVCKKEVKGFIANKISWGVMAAAKEIAREKCICSVDDVDKAIMYGPGLRMAVTGQLLTMSLGVQGGRREYEKKYSERIRHRKSILRWQMELMKQWQLELPGRDVHRKM